MRFSFFISAIFVSLLISMSVFAGTPQIFIWIGPEGGDWNATGNWNIGVVPVACDPVGGPQASPYSIAQFNTTHTSPNLDGTVVVACDVLRVGDSSPGTSLTLNGGTINVSEIVYLSYTSGEVSTLNMNGGTINSGARIPANGKFYVGRAGNGTINMGNGTINIPAALTIADMSGSTGWVHLNGGTIYASDLLMNTSGAHLDIAGGTLILDGDDTAAINGFVTAGKITAYGGGAGTSVLRDYNVTNAGKTTVTGFILSPKAINPNPFNNAINTNVNLALTWTAGLGATSHNVYFGTTNSLTSQGSVSDASFNPGALDPNKTYYWRIDEVSGSSTATGDLWTFATTIGRPIGPSPANDETGVSIRPILSWTGGLGATGHNVYFGITNPPALVSSNQISTTYDPCNLWPNTTYFWTIEELYGSTVISGPVWNFQIAATKASPSASEFSPPNIWDITTGTYKMAVNMPISGITLAWTVGDGAVSHDVYFGTTNPPVLQVNQTDTSFPLTNALAANTTYYWRIDEKDGSGGTTIGDIWSFTTGAPVGIYPYLTFRGDPTTTITVNWWNPAAQGDSSVDYGLNDAYGSTVNVAATTRFHHVELTGLTEDTTYHYRIRSTDSTVGTDNTFKTAPAQKSRSFKFAFYSDPRTTELDEGGIYSARQEALCNWMAGQDIAFAIEGGDTVWEGASLRGLGKYWPDFFKYEQNLTKSKVVMHTLGGHEVQGGGTHYYWNDFYTAAFPANGAAGTNGRLYSFDYANAHFVCCASEQVDWNTEKDWLRADMTAAKARGAEWIFAYFHYPLYTTSGHFPRQPDIAALGPIFDEFGVNIAFQSHNHLYERFYPLDTYFDTATNLWTGKIASDGNAPVYITNGCGGAEFNSGDPSDPRLVCSYGLLNLNTTLATIITVNEDIISDFEPYPKKACRVQTIRNDTGEVIDSFEIFTPVQLIPGDYNKDGIVDIKDLGILAASWLNTGMWP